MSKFMFFFFHYTTVVMKVYFFFMKLCITCLNYRKECEISFFDLQLSELAKLKPIPDLTQLTIAENPLSQLPHSRMYIIFHLRSLEVLDSQNVTGQERQYAKERFEQGNHRLFVSRIDIVFLILGNRISCQGSSIFADLSVLIGESCFLSLFCLFYVVLFCLFLF